RRAPSATGSGLVPTRHSSSLLPVRLSVTTIANIRIFPLRQRSRADHKCAAHILKGAEAPLWDPHLSAREGAGGRLASCSSGALRVEGGESRLHFLARRLRIDVISDRGPGARLRLGPRLRIWTY